MVRCSKVRAMFAMRACRKSVMIGMSLTHPQMTNVRLPFVEFELQHMGHVLTHIWHVTGCSAYGHDGPAVELSPWAAHNAASCRSARNINLCGWGEQSE